MPQEKPVIVALDFSTARNCREFIEHIDPAKCRVKVGKELFTAAGPALVRDIVGAGFDVFLDLKFHDIPNTVAGALGVARDLGVWMVNVHALGGRAMLEAARAALDERDAPLLIGVTVLTSIGEDDLRDIGIVNSPLDEVMQLAALTRECGLDGVVCSSRETALLRERFGADFCLVTPGIRPAGDAADDQKRVETPASAIAAGSDFLVIGRPVTRARDPDAKLDEILREIAGTPGAS